MRGKVSADGYPALKDAIYPKTILEALPEGGAGRVRFGRMHEVTGG